MMISNIVLNKTVVFQMPTNLVQIFITLTPANIIPQVYPGTGISACGTAGASGTNRMLFSFAARHK